MPKNERAIFGKNTARLFSSGLIEALHTHFNEYRTPIVWPKPDPPPAK